MRSLISFFLLASLAQANQLYNPESKASYPGIRYYAKFLKSYVKPSGVNYKGARKELPKLKSYLQRYLKQAPPSYDKSRDSLAYFLNLYNIVVLVAVLERYPIKSVLKTDKGQFFNLPFRLGKESMSLNDLENKLIRPRFKEPLIHFALNCASVSCPPLRSEPYYAKPLRQQLASQARAYLKKKQYLSYDSKNNQVNIVELFNWYKEDFPKLIPFLNKYSSYKSIPPGAVVKYTRYNWSLNEQ